MITEQQYIFTVGVQGMQALGSLSTAIQYLDGKYKTLSSSMSLLASASLNTQYALRGNEQLISSKVVNTTQLFDKSTGKLTSDIMRMTDVVKLANGEFIKYNYTLEKLAGRQFFGVKGPGEAHPVAGAELAQLQASQKPKGFLSGLLGEDIDIGGLVKRAAVTIPVWMAMRTAMNATFSIIPEGINRFKELNTAVAQMGSLTSGITDFSKFTEDAMKRINALSRETGVSIEEAKKAYIALSETGLNSEVAFSGMDAAVKGGISTMTDSYGLARALAGAYNNLGNTVDVGATGAEKMQYMMALTNVLFKENAGTVEEYTQSLTASVNAAANAGMSFKELMVNIATLATAMQRSSMSGTAIRRTFEEIAQERQKFGEFLGREIRDENIENYNLVLIEIVNKFKQMKDAGQDIVPTINELFGSRSRKEVEALVNNFDKQGSNTALANSLQTMEQVKNVNLTDLTRQLDTLVGQLNKLKQAFGDISQSFFSGIFGQGGESIIKMLSALNSSILTNADAWKTLGQTITTVASGVGLAMLVTKFGMLNLSLAALPSLLIRVQGVLGLLTGQLAIMGGVLATNPIFFLAGALTAVIGLLGTFGEASKIRKNAAYEYIKGRATDGSNSGNALSVEDILKEVNDLGLGNYSEKDPKVKAALQQGLDAFKKRQLGKVSSVSSDVRQAGDPLNYRSFEQREQDLQKLKAFGLDDIQIQERKYELMQKQNKVKEWQLELEKLQIAEQNKYSAAIQNTLQQSLYKNLSGEDNDIVVDLQIANRDQMRKSISELVSSSIMSTGIGDIFAKQFGFVDETRRAITDPILEAHTSGGEKVASAIDKIFAKWSGKISQQAEGTNLVTAKKVSGADPTGLLSHAAITNQKAEVERVKWTQPEANALRFTPSPITYTPSSSGFATGGFRSPLPASYQGNISYSEYYKRVNRLGAENANMSMRMRTPNAVTLEPINISKSRGDLADMSDFFPLTGSGMDEQLATSDQYLADSLTTTPATFAEYQLQKSPGKRSISAPLSISGLTAGYTGGRGKLPGIWEYYNKRPILGYKATATGTTLTSPSGFQASGINFKDKGPSWGQVGYTATALGSSVITAADGVNQIKGGGAKNITQGVGQVAGAIGMGATALTMASIAGSGTLFAAGTATAAAGGLAFLGPLGLAIMAVLMIASLFMKGPKQTSTQVQTSETKVGSKIDISNKKLELINRNLIALRNTLETYSLATSAYFSEKQYGNIDSEFALSTRRSY